MQPEVLHRVTLIFNLLDADGSGSLAPDDFELMSARVSAAATGSGDAAKSAAHAAFRRFWTTLAAELDADGDGVVSFEEFSACVLSPERFDETIADFADSLATLGDPDGDGLIERPLFLALMTAIGFDPAGINALFDAFEPTEADEISVASWTQAIKDYYAPDKAGITADLLVTNA
ncbi:Ca2+-binding EF-hand superfamily protein [Actinoalloteichus hoggarensis]|uniref:EF hand n=1 Tax=Actinoalloteichus hoggarensis TaxID=1470176 RepID=A0A221W4I9_9PSEU|nr:EF-hand domain-containing protein [Actinoalloteichus hoggarensis]ASO20758.1 EF hand [Actinoalloteichus hoggarensis]MBB5920688.1 Ca2+-binding EF-hand superfamily protein [Actinoalloteichus hoggarensis]